MEYGLTPKQEHVFNFICEFVSNHGYSPSIREIGKGVGLKSSSTVHGYLQRLERNGFITIGRERVRSIQILKAVQLCPHCGRPIDE